MLLLQDLIKNGQAFARLVDEFGSQDQPTAAAGTLAARAEATGLKVKLQSGAEDPEELMQKEERNVGQVETVI